MKYNIEGIQMSCSALLAQATKTMEAWRPSEGGHTQKPGLWNRKQPYNPKI
jgi:hypothetical protein